MASDEKDPFPAFSGGRVQALLRLSRGGRQNREESVLSDWSLQRDFMRAIVLPAPLQTLVGEFSKDFCSQKPGNHPNFEKKALGVKRPFSEQLSKFRGIPGAILGMALMTLCM